MVDVDISARWTGAGGEQRVVVTSEGPPVDIDFRAGMCRRGRPPRRLCREALRLTDGASVEVTTTWTGGLAVAPPRIDLQPGQRSTGLRIIDLVAADDGWLLTLEGAAGRDYAVQLVGTPVDAVADDDTATVSSESDGVVRVHFTGGEGRVTTIVRLTPTDP